MLSSTSEELPMLRLLFLSFLLLPLSARAASYEYDLKKCREMMQETPPDVQIVYNFGELKYDFSKTDKEIRKVAESQKIKVPLFGKMRGLTSLSPSIEIATEMGARMLPDGRYCVYPSIINIKTWYTPVVYIDKDIPKDSCKYKLTLRHEQTHLDIAHYVFLVFVQALKVQIPQIIQRVGPFVDSETEGVAEKKNQEYAGQIKGVFDVFVNALAQKNGEIDTKENYIREDNFCR